MTTEQRFKKYEKCRRDPLAFLHLVRTYDPHEQDTTVKRIGKPFPADMDYVKMHADRWFNTKGYASRLLIVAKSRQMLLTWLFVALYCWDTWCNWGQYTIFRSDKLGKAADKSNKLTLLGRAIYILKRIERDYPDFLVHIWGEGYELAKPKMMPLAMWVFPNESTIHCITSNPDDVRQFTVTGVLDDEKASQERQLEADRALAPELGVIARWTKISSAVGGTEFEKTFKDE